MAIRFFTTLFLTALFTIFLAGCNPSAKSTFQFEPIPAPEFSLTERSGKMITKADLKDNVWVAAFVFTRCTGPCPTVSASMARLQKELLPNRPNVKLVTFTVDPDRDTPEELKKYAEKFNASSEQWLFLTGKEDEVKKLLTNGFKVNVAKKADGKPGDEFDHSTKLMVVNKKGEICGYFDGMKRDWDQDGSIFEADFKKLFTMVDGLR